MGVRTEQHRLRANCGQLTPTRGAHELLEPVAGTNHRAVGAHEGDFLAGDVVQGPNHRIQIEAVGDNAGEPAMHLQSLTGLLVAFGERLIRLNELLGNVAQPLRVERPRHANRGQVRKRRDQRHIVVGVVEHPGAMRPARR